MIMSACTLSQYEFDSTITSNLGFEYWNNNLPSNWIIYSPKTVTEVDFKIIDDTLTAFEGKHALRFEVKSYSKGTGNLSPGISNEFKNFYGKASYKVSCRIKNQNTNYKIILSSVDALNCHEKKVICTSSTDQDWKLIEFEINVEKNDWLRFELNVLSPGNFSIDDLKVEKIIN